MTNRNAVPDFFVHEPCTATSVDIGPNHYPIDPPAYLVPGVRYAIDTEAGKATIRHALPPTVPFALTDADWARADGADDLVFRIGPKGTGDD